MEASWDFRMSKRVENAELRYLCYCTGDGYTLKIRYGTDEVTVTDLPRGKETRNMIRTMFDGSVTPCTARDVLEDLSGQQIIMKTIYKDKRV